jgi:DNA repair protein RecO (recombination protein O)
VEWTDSGIVLSARLHGETGSILEALTRAHGRHLGLIRGGASRRFRPLLQSGNTVQLHWRARLSEHLGNYAAELLTPRAGTLFERRDALTGLNAFASVASAVLPERVSHQPVFEAAEVLLDTMAAGDFLDWAPLYVRWEAGLLDELGFGLDLSACAATGTRDDLTFVSPRSGRAVSTAAAKPYEGRLLALPAFLLGSQDGTASPQDIDAGLRLTGHFLAQRVLAPHNQGMPAGRTRLSALAAHESK